MPAGSGPLRADISNALVGLKAKWYGKGPERARTYLAGDKVWLYATILTVGYMVSRGLAKSGSREPYFDGGTNEQRDR